MLKIGAFALQAGVTVKTLRFYDRAGLFPPARIDPRTGYRYYTPEQVTTLRQLRLLRVLGCGIEDLRRWVACPADSNGRGALLASLRSGLRNRVAADLERLRLIEECLQRGSAALASFGKAIPRECNIPPTAGLTIRDRVRSLKPAAYKMFESAERTVARHGARTSGRPFLLFHDQVYRDRNVDIEVCVPILPASLSATGGRIVEGAARAACLSFAGSYDQGPGAYDAVQRWLILTGSRAAGPLRERYVRFGADQLGYTLPSRILARCEQDYRTELQLPIARA